VGVVTGPVVVGTGVDVRWSLIAGDCIERLRDLDAASVDAVVTDPPYEIAMMGKGWDRTGVAFSPATWREVLRVIKPGGHLVAFGAPRSYHRLACAIEDAGFDIRDSLHWCFGSGFPKSHDVSKAIDKAAGAEREVIRQATRAGNAERRGAGEQGSTYGDSHGGFTTFSDPVTESAKRWDGWGTALKPAHEPIVLARRALDGTVSETVLRFGTGAINVEGCRVGAGDIPGRWPPNVLLSHVDGCERIGEARIQSTGHYAAARPASATLSGPEGHGGQAGLAERHTRGESVAVYRCVEGCPVAEIDRQDGRPQGGPSRFFPCFHYEQKAARTERESGLAKAEKGWANLHPTVKPVGIMRWLCRLVTPPDGVVLDPFAGSGSTGIAALREGFRFVGIEREDTYISIARRRLEEDAPLFSRVR
jgi:site-specific DNA-methyltransferase (adenine-specific)